MLDDCPRSLAENIKPFIRGRKLPIEIFIDHSEQLILPRPLLNQLKS